ncbi:MAG TPA: ion channel [Spirochaetota bacterium]|nr:ion channel [Spirochaetota bacterium]HPI89441.1 ion channel [Spirochaetota bacterium]HPR46891.1 ion channel [Spirochaetota bacterium]
MNLKEHIQNKRESKILKEYLHKIVKSTLFKLMVTSLVVLVAFSAAVYIVEKNYIVYTYENGERIEDSAHSSNIRTWQDSVWWAFVTSTTVGYGDYYPKSTAGRIAGILLMFFGVSLVGVITGNIASLLVEKQLKEGRGLKELKLKNHFIICGWKREMGEVLAGIMDKNRSFLPSEIVLITTADQQEIENLKADQKFSRINYINGDYIDERVLKRANLREASRVLILADILVKGSVQEVDSRTVMTIITIKSISKRVYTAAELLDAKFERYLRFSNCDEIILSSQYNRSLIANASAGSGISHVISELLNVQAGVSINTYEVPRDFIGKQFSDLAEYYLAKDRSILIGLLENTGNFFMRKKEAIQEAQKTPDISTLVDNLKTVKGLMANLPVINPQPDYAIKKFSRAIIIEGQSARSHA